MADRLALSGVVGFSVGILLASFASPHIAFAGLFAVIASALLALFARFKERAVLIVAVFFLAFAIGIGRVSLVPAEPAPFLLEHMENEVALSGIVVAPPDVRETTQRIPLLVRGQGEPFRVLVVSEKFPEVSVGDYLEATGTLQHSEPFLTDGGRVFRYDLFLKKDGIFALLSFADIEIVGREHGLFFDGYRILSTLKPAFLDALGASLVEPYASLAGGLIAGGKEGLPETLQDAFIQTGLIHIVVLSGYNVMIVAEFVRRVLLFFPAKIGFSAAGATVLLFVLASGAGAASIRAGLMALIALWGRATGRTYVALRALLFVGLLMLLHNPLLLSYDPGFQLSFIATLGLLLGTPLLEPLFSFVRIKLLRELASATLAAQIAVLPLLLYQTGLLSFVAFPANVLVLPVVPLAMGLSFFASIFGFIVPVIAPLAGLPALIVLGYITAVTEALAALPLSSVTIPPFPFALVVAVYGLLGYAVYRATRLRASQLPPN